MCRNAPQAEGHPGDNLNWNDPASAPMVRSGNARLLGAWANHEKAKHHWRELNMKTATAIIAVAAAILLSPNAGTSSFAGKECNANLFVTSYQNDQNHEVLGKYAQDKGIKKAFIMAPNYQAGKDALAGFKRYFKGEVVDEVYVPLNQLDYSAELSKIAAASPEAIFVFLPGGMGVNFVKQFRQAGLAEKITFLSAFTVDESTLPAQQDAALGMFGGTNWAPNLDNPENKKFVADFEKEYNAVPGSYAFQAYDAAQLIDSAVRD